MNLTETRIRHLVRGILSEIHMRPILPQTFQAMLTLFRRMVETLKGNPAYKEGVAARDEIMELQEAGVRSSFQYADDPRVVRLHELYRIQDDAQQTLANDPMIRASAAGITKILLQHLPPEVRTTATARGDTGIIEGWLRRDASYSALDSFDFTEHRLRNLIDGLPTFIERD